MKVLTNFAGQNWLITPAALAVGENPPASIHDQKFLLVLSGVVIANLEGNSTSQWLHETLSFIPDMAGPQNSGPLNWAINRFVIPKPPGQNFSIGFSLEEWVPFASLSSIFNEGQSIDSGFAVDVWRPTHFVTGTDAFTHLPVGNIFAGIDVDVAVRDTDAWLYRVGYNISLLGRIVFLSIPEALFRSNFNLTQVGQPPGATQDVGTAQVEGPLRSVIVIPSPAAPPVNWVRIDRPTGADVANAVFRGIFSHAGFDGVYTLSTTLLMTSASGKASIGFETGTGVEFLHLDFTQNNTVQVDDIGPSFGSFPFGQPFLVQVTLTINSSQYNATAHIVLSGNGASGQLDYTVIEPFQLWAGQFGAVTVWQGFPNSGAFDATSIVVTREV